MNPRKSYYGAAFWISVVSFVVPLVVAARAFQAIRPTSRPTPQPDVSGVDHALWDYLLKAYVAHGLVDYQGLARDHLFRTYLRQIGAAQPDKLDRGGKLAFYCNAYNALVIQGVIVHKITTSVMDFKAEGKGFFDLREHIVAGQTLSLNDLEHKIIRPRFQDPRIHMALVCAARSCPSIRSEAYVGDRVDKQLEDQAHLFCNNPKYVRFDPETKTVYLSPILKWYGKDWKALGGYLPWLAIRVEDPNWQQALKLAERQEVKVAFLPYDWSLNQQADGGTGGAQRSTDFGSGSIPNE